jgi:hypothetical protein
MIFFLDGYTRRGNVNHFYRFISDSYRIFSLLKKEGRWMIDWLGLMIGIYDISNIGECCDYGKITKFLTSSIFVRYSQYTSVAAKPEIWYQYDISDRLSEHRCSLAAVNKNSRWIK